MTIIRIKKKKTTDMGGDCSFFSDYLNHRYSFSVCTIVKLQGIKNVEFVFNSTFFVLFFAGCAGKYLWEF